MKKIIEKIQNQVAESQDQLLDSLTKESETDDDDPMEDEIDDEDDSMEIEELDDDTEEEKAIDSDFKTSVFNSPSRSPEGNNYDTDHITVIDTMDDQVSMVLFNTNNITITKNVSKHLLLREVYDWLFKRSVYSFIKKIWMVLYITAIILFSNFSIKLDNNDGITYSPFLALLCKISYILHSVDIIETFVNKTCFQKNHEAIHIIGESKLYIMNNSHLQVLI